MNPVYIRVLAYVLSTLAGMIPASWAGWVSYNAEIGALVVSVEGLAGAIVIGLAGSLAVLQKWGTK